jgi:hypothetical protein
VYWEPLRGARYKVSGSFFDSPLSANVSETATPVKFTVEGDGVVSNEERPHSGKHCFGKTPMHTLLDSKHLATQKHLNRSVGQS